jgi:hypothetical protein
MVCPFWTRHNKTVEVCPSAVSSAYWLENDGDAFDGVISGFGDGNTVRTVGNDWVDGLSWVVGPYSGTPTSVVVFSNITANAGQNSIYVVARLVGLSDQLAEWSFAGDGTAVGLAVLGDMHLVRIRPDPPLTSVSSTSVTTTLTITPSYGGVSFNSLNIQARFNVILV